MSDSKLKSNYDGFEIAVIGMAGRFPGANSISELWENLKAGKESITFFSEEELKESGVKDFLLSDPNYIRARGTIENADKFDASFFDFYPREVEVLDPQQRKFLECSWEALEDAGYNPEKYPGLIGVFGGVGMNTYLYTFLNSNKEFISSSEGYQLSIGNDKDFLSTRVSYKMNLRGPSIDVQTACSTSLVATHIACMNLLNYQCDMALAGGSTISFPQKSGYYYQEGMILSPDGHCKPFDANANGTVPGSGTGIVVLKRLNDALEDGDHIYAIIKGSAYNNDGALRVGYTAPGVNGQAEVIAAAQAMANVNPESISYIETHGTGTSMGDPIEISALTQAFREHTNKNGFCAIGSVKSNLGHLDTASGITGLIKTVLSLYHKTLVPSINYSNPNPKINFDESPFLVNTHLKEWKSNGSPLRAGVSSFGIGGTNAHVILEEAPKISSETQRKYGLFLLSAKSKEVLNSYTKNLGQYLKNNNINTIHAAYTLAVGRKHFNERRIVVDRDRHEIAAAMEQLDPKKILEASKVEDNENVNIVFMFSGQGSQYIKMGKDLYEKEKVFKETFDYCNEYLNKLIGVDFRKIVYPNPSDKSFDINDTEFAQPLLFIIEYSMSKLLMSWGISPEAMVGHSIGEYVAACLSGVLSLEDALQLLAFRGKVMQSLEKGAMLSLNLSEAEVQPFLIEGISLAAINSHNLTVLSGSFSNISKVEDLLNGKGINYRKLHTSHAFHSEMMEPIISKFEEEVSKVKLNIPAIPYLSNVTGTWIKDYEATDPKYYSNHLRYTVRFADNMKELLDDETRIFIEVGPGNVLTTFAKNLISTKNRLVLQSMRHPKDNLNDYAFLLGLLGRLWLNGINIDWAKLYEEEEKHRISLPTYPFELKRYWLKIGKSSSLQGGKLANDELDWIYLPTWKRDNIRNEINLIDHKNYLILSRKRDVLISELINYLNSKKQSITNIIHQSNQDDECFYSKDDFVVMLRDLEKLNKIPDTIFCSANSKLDENTKGPAKISSLASRMNALVDLTKAIKEVGIKKDINIIILTNYLFDIIGSEKLNIDQSLLLGVSKVINQEFQNIKCRIVDIDKNVSKEMIMRVLSYSDLVTAVRNNKRWVRVFEKVKDKVAIKDKSLIREEGVYLVTGGLGRIGLTIAEFLSENYHAKIALLGRTNKLQNDEEIKNVIEVIKQNGSELLFIESDVSDFESMEKGINEIQKKFGVINGIFHGAGLTGDKAFQPIDYLDREIILEQLEAKVAGINNINYLIDKNELDFVVLQSSIAAVVGGVGLAAYSSANNYLNSFAEKMNGEDETKWVSINWDTWNFPDQKESIIKSKLNKNSFLPKQGIKFLDLVLKTDIKGSVIISTEDLEERILEQDKSDEKNDIEEVEMHDRPNIPTPYKEASSELELDILKVWQKLLGIGKIGIYDNFFELGGNSLLGTQLVSDLRKEFQVELPLQSLFDDPTINGVVKIIVDEQGQIKKNTAAIKNVLDHIEKLSDDEVEKMLREREQS